MQHVVLSREADGHRNVPVVRLMPWKLVSRFLPCTSSATSLNLRYATSSFCRSASEHSNTRPLSESEASLLAIERFTSVLPMLRTLNMFGARTSYHSFRENGSITFFFWPFLPPFWPFCPFAIFCYGCVPTVSAKRIKA